jgi:hypothetical protein
MTRSFFRASLGSALVLAACASLTNTASAQLNSNNAAVALTATLAEALTVVATPALVNFSLAPGGVSQGSDPVVITTSWILAPSRSTVKLFGWFAVPSAALSDGLIVLANNIPSSSIYGQMTTGTPTTYTPFTQTNTLGAASGGLLLFTQNLTGTNRFASRTDNLLLQLNLTTQTQLPSGIYAGLLNLQAQAL